MPAAKADIPEVTVPKPGRYVTIPDTDLFDQPHPPIRINHHVFGPGTHFIEDPVLADTVEDRLKVHTKANVRILQPKKDVVAEQVVSQGRGSATTTF